MYEATTRGIKVSVLPEYVEQQSDPEDDYYFWAYTVTIANHGSESVQLKTRYWKITDANGLLQEVRGPGVVGKTPVLAPGESFTYTSGCPLRTEQGFMVGTYQMENEAGEVFDIDIPAFSLDRPDSDLRPN
ncbi:MAG: hypothetical protein RLZ98_1601 [Pseudomonadota bacterium]|jgi:ApaG protein